MIQDIAPKKLFNEYRPGARPAPDSAVCFIKGREIALLKDEDGFLRMPRIRECGDLPGLTYLFSVDSTMYFFPEGESAAPPAGCVFKPVRSLRSDSGAPDRAEIFAAFTALQLVLWYRDNRFCGTCGSHTVHGDKERSILCPSCGRVIYPRIIPAVIVGVIHGDYLLHTKYASARGISYYALIAGFTEIGETLEETVAREVMEEVGLRVKNIRYYASQPWGIADDLLAGFYCEVDGSTDITLDSDELKEAVWIHRNDITGQPNDFSLTNHMMTAFRDGKEHLPPQ